MNSGKKQRRPTHSDPAGEGDQNGQFGPDDIRQPNLAQREQRERQRQGGESKWIVLSAVSVRRPLRQTTARNEGSRRAKPPG